MTNVCVGDRVFLSFRLVNFSPRFISFSNPFFQLIANVSLNPLHIYFHAKPHDIPYELNTSHTYILYSKTYYNKLDAGFIWVLLVFLMTSLFRYFYFSFLFSRKFSFFFCCKWNYFSRRLSSFVIYLLFCFVKHNIKTYVITAMFQRENRKH